MAVKKLIQEQKQWHGVAKELEAENLKLASYDKTLLSTIGNMSKKNILDYGAGPGILALALQKLGANIKVYDINPEMRKNAGKKIGKSNVYSDINKIPQNHFNVIICNLVLCIVPEQEVKFILSNMKNLTKQDGTVYIGFCNPKIFNVPESNLDFRFTTGKKYAENHEYKKIKKEGNYEIIELHRPIEWYEEEYKKAGFKVSEKSFTPEYELKGNKINDFIIFKLTKNKN